MIDPTTRAAQHHETMTVIEGAKIGKPKPTKAGRKAMVKSPILPPKPKKVPVAKQRKKLEKQVEAIVKMIIAWRDGQECVMRGRGKCGGGLMWNHLVAQGKSPWLRYDLGNVHWGCGTHNMEDHHGSTVFPAWFISTFGPDAFEALDKERQEHIGRKPGVVELTEMLAKYDQLYQDRFYVSADIPSLVAAGYYGEIVRGALSPARVTERMTK